MTKIVFFSKHDPFDARSWSGSAKYIYEGITEYFSDVEVIVAKEPKIFGYLKRKLHNFFSEQNVNIDLSRTTYYSRFISFRYKREIEAARPDIVVCVASSAECAFMQFPSPYIHISDASYTTMLSYYGSFSNVPGFFQKHGKLLESRVTGRAAKCVLASDWARLSVIRDYGVPQERVCYIPFGASIKDIPESSEEYFSKKFSGQLKLLFVGREWKRKGGNVVLSAFRHLKKRGMNVVLTIVGSRPQEKVEDKDVTIYEYLDKNNSDDTATLSKLYRESSCFILPTEAECAGVVFAEASAYGTPSVATDTGGVSSMVVNGENGLLLSPDATGMDYADQIEMLWNDKVELHEMGNSTIRRYQEILNWSAWGKSFKEVVDEIIKAQGRTIS